MAKLEQLLAKTEINLEQLDSLIQPFKTSNSDSQYLLEVVESLIRNHKRLVKQSSSTTNIKLMVRDVEFSLRQGALLHNYLSDSNQHFLENMRSCDQAITLLTDLEKNIIKYYTY